jgi:hypothetical protein
MSQYGFIWVAIFSVPKSVMKQRPALKRSNMLHDRSLAQQQVWQTAAGAIQHGASHPAVSTLPGIPPDASAPLTSRVGVVLAHRTSYDRPGSLMPYSSTIGLVGAPAGAAASASSLPAPRPPDSCTQAVATPFATAAAALAASDPSFVCAPTTPPKQTAAAPATHAKEPVERPALSIAALQGGRSFALADIRTSEDADGDEEESQAGASEGRTVPPATAELLGHGAGPKDRALRVASDAATGDVQSLAGQLAALQAEVR